MKTSNPYFGTYVWTQKNYYISLWNATHEDRYMSAAVYWRSIWDARLDMYMSPPWVKTRLARQFKFY